MARGGAARGAVARGEAARGAAARGAAARRDARGAAALTLAALAIVLASAALHAGWNALVADAEDTHATTAVALLVGAAVFAIPAALTWRVERGGVAVHRRLGRRSSSRTSRCSRPSTPARDLSFAYPIARGSAPVLVLLISVVALGATVGLAAAAGVLAVTAGVLLVRGDRTRRRRTRPRSRWRSASAPASPATRSSTTTACATPAALPYFELILVASALPYAAAVLAVRGTSALASRHGPPVAAAGVGMVAAYVLVLEALERAEAAPVAALRETSVVMATARRRARWAASASRSPRIAGAVLVVAGVAALALG